MSNSEVGPALPQGFPLPNHLLHSQDEDSTPQNFFGAEEKRAAVSLVLGGDAPVPWSGSHRLVSPRDRVRGAGGNPGLPQGGCWGDAA